MGFGRKLRIAAERARARGQQEDPNGYYSDVFDDIVMRDDFPLDGLPVQIGTESDMPDIDPEIREKLMKSVRAHEMAEFDRRRASGATAPAPSADEEVGDQKSESGVSEIVNKEPTQRVADFSLQELAQMGALLNEDDVLSLIR